MRVAPEEDDVSSNQDKPSEGASGPRLAPRPVSRPPVDAATGRTFSRPAGVEGSFVAEELRPRRFRDSDEFTATSKRPDPVLHEAFGRPYPGGESLQRHPVDAGALEAEKATAEEPEDPWRDPAAPAGLGSPAVPESEPAPAPGGVGKLEIGRAHV